jgi:hypothetical protein
MIVDSLGFHDRQQRLLGTVFNGIWNLISVLIAIPLVFINFYIYVLNVNIHTNTEFVYVGR